MLHEACLECLHKKLATDVLSVNVTTKPYSIQTPLTSPLPPLVACAQQVASYQDPSYFATGYGFRGRGNHNHFGHGHGCGSIFGSHSSLLSGVKPK